MKHRVTGWVLVLAFLLLNLGMAAPLKAVWLDDAMCETPRGGAAHCCTFCVFFCRCTLEIPPPPPPGG